MIRFTRAVPAAALATSILLTACEGGRATGMSPANPPADGTVIRRSAHGIPHIQAADFAGLGYGYGYAVAQDNICRLADFYVTVNGERSKYFGAEQSFLFPANLMSFANADSDFFFKMGFCLCKKRPMGKPIFGARRMRTQQGQPLHRLLMLPITHSLDHHNGQGPGQGRSIIQLQRHLARLAQVCCHRCVIAQATRRHRGTQVRDQFDRRICLWLIQALLAVLKCLFVLRTRRT
mgnify:CR=1 FL=1